MSATIEGPLGPFRIPESDHPRTREVCEALTRSVFDGEYAHPDLPANAREVIDIGAGWGAFTTWALERWPRALVFAYEPHGKAAAVFEENLRAPSGEIDSRVSLTVAAVTTDPAPRLNGCEDWGAYHIAPPGDTCAWPVLGWHPMDLPKCDVFKCDAEGAEVDILSNYPHLSECKALLIEFHTADNRRTVREIAEAAGFRCVREADADSTYGVMVWVRS